MNQPKRSQPQLQHDQSPHSHFQKTQRHYHPKQQFLALLLALTMLFSLAGTAFAATQNTYPTTSQEAYEILMSFKHKEGFREGAPWDNTTPYGTAANSIASTYQWNGGPIKAGGFNVTCGVGCAAFTFILSDAVFGNLKCRTIARGDFSYNDIHVGDILRIYGGTHSVIVTQVTPAGCIVAEANVNKSVHWGRVISKSIVMDADYLVTRWPAGYPDDQGIGEEVKPENQGTLNSTLTWQMTNSGTLTIAGTGTMPNYDGVTSKAPWADLPYNTVIVADGVTSIGSAAFYGKETLVEAIIPGSVKTIGANAFRNCSQLISASIPDGVQEIGDNAFRYCASLTAVDLPSSIVKLGSGVFMDCQSLQIAIFANSKAGAKLEIGGGLFANCYWLCVVVLPSNLPKITGGMFQSCKMLGGLMIPKTVTQIDRDVFNASGIQKIVFEGSRNDWYNASAGGTSLTALGLPINFPLDVAIAQGIIVVNHPYVNPFATDGDDMIADNEVPEHQHSWSSAWQSDNTHHWHECTTDDCPITENSEKGGYSLHEYQGTSNICKDCGVKHQHMLATGDFWESDATGHWKKCTIANCPNEAELQTNAVAHVFNGTICTICGYEHQHTWSTGNVYGQDEDEHWRICTDENCPLGHDDNAAQNDLTYHEYGDNGKCVCGAEKPLEEHTHDWEDTWSTDTDEGGNHHWQNCKTCTAQNHYGEHVYAEDETVCDICGEARVITPEPEREHVDENNDGVCDKCGEIIGNSDLPTVHIHDWSNVWSHDSTSHWYNCLRSDCLITDNGEKLSYGTHTFGDWSIDVNATASDDGSQHRDCTICAYRETTTIPATGGSSTTTPSAPVRPSANPTQPVTTTTTDPATGIKTETTKYPDGSSTVVTTQPNGITTTVATSKSGQSTTTVNISEAAITAAGGQAILLPVNKVYIYSSLAIALAITITSTTGAPVKVTIPTITTPSLDTLAFIIYDDGTTAPVQTSTIASNGITATVPSGSKVKLVQHSIYLSDITPDAWYQNAVSFTTARNLFSDTGESRFSPELPMTRAMLMTVLARLDGVDLTGGDTWYSKGMEWAVVHGISDGTDPNSNITREQLVTMLWRYVGRPATTGNLDNFIDSAQVSDYASRAMRWAYENGIIHGTGNGQLDPQGPATRAQVAQFLLNFIEKTYS